MGLFRKAAITPRERYVSVANSSSGNTCRLANEKNGKSTKDQQERESQLKIPSGFLVIAVKMSAVVQICMGELAKLGEKVKGRKPFVLRAKKEQVHGKEDKKESTKEVEDESTISETTICLLMDRFVPW
ncbi:hypothetical protein WN944_028969 [Citrus x changshan-huyou]|uniref:Uncharacterized protein n=1 Tax=Citrus x changshan-huyou TaxID=2935761 RepID=A0AAP0LNR8_9ROSI